MTGGIDIKALDVPKRLFGAARTFDEGGTLTVLATCLIETGSRMDEIIFQEFKGTGNMEVVLDRKLADRRVWPAIDIQQSGTRKEERLLDPETLARVTLLRRSLSEIKPMEAMEGLVKQLGKTPATRSSWRRSASSRRTGEPGSPPHRVLIRTSRNFMAAPSDWKANGPRSGMAAVPRLTSTPLKTLTIEPPRLVISAEFHAPTGRAAACWAFASVVPANEPLTGKMRPASA